MTATRIFFSTTSLNDWLGKGAAELDGEEMVIAEHGLRLRIISAVRFLEVLTEYKKATANLVGKVKDLEQLKKMKADHYEDSVVLDDIAYRVEEGFLGVPATAKKSNAPKKGKAASTTELDILAQLFVQKKNK